MDVRGGKKKNNNKTISSRVASVFILHYYNLWDLFRSFNLITTHYPVIIIIYHCTPAMGSHSRTGWESRKSKPAIFIFLRYTYYILYLIKPIVVAVISFLAIPPPGERFDPRERPGTTLPDDSNANSYANPARQT